MQRLLLCAGVALMLGAPPAYAGFVEEERPPAPYCEANPATELCQDLKRRAERQRAIREELEDRRRRGVPLIEIPRARPMPSVPLPRLHPRPPAPRLTPTPPAARQFDI
jgi:hypothetical protein